MNKSFVVKLSNFMAGVGFCLFFSATFMMARFYAIGASSPDPATERIFPLQAHGTLYVRPDQGHLFLWVANGSEGRASSRGLTPQACASLNLPEWKNSWLSGWYEKIRVADIASSPAT